MRRNFSPIIIKATLHKLSFAKHSPGSTVVRACCEKTGHVTKNKNCCGMASKVAPARFQQLIRIAFEKNKFFLDTRHKNTLY